VSTSSALDVRELLRLLAEQQASLVKLQQLVVEHVLADSQPDSSTIHTPPAPPASDLVAAIDASNVVSPAQETPSDPDLARSTESEPVPAAPDSAPPESGAVLSELPDTTTPSPPQALPSPSAPTISTDSPFGDTLPEEAGANTPTDRFPVNTNRRQLPRRPLSETSRQCPGHAGDEPGACIGCLVCVTSAMSLSWCSSSVSTAARHCSRLLRAIPTIFARSP
jgi:hypothetical protein